MWINIKTGYSFKQVYGHLDKIAEKCKKLCEDAGIKKPYGGVADLGNTFAHIPWKKACEKVGIKPIYGVKLPVVDELQRNKRFYHHSWMTFIAKTQKGLQEIYKLVDLSWQQMYYRQRITYDQVNELSGDVIVLGGVAPNGDLLKKETWMELSPSTPLCNRDWPDGMTMASIDNFYPDAEDVDIYEPFADERLRERKTCPIHILTKNEWLSECENKTALYNTIDIASACNVELPKAPMVKYIGDDDIEEWCKKGAKEKGLINKKEYIERYKREMKLIKEKGYVDYFLVVADLIRYAKTKMCVGGGRGSAAGSLVCYLMGITEDDPLVYDLYFERFIDVNRFDLPDIDIDFQDDKRHLVTKYLEKKYGKENVAQIANINRLKPKSAMTRFAGTLGIPLDEIHEMKDAVIERAGGDARAHKCMEDTFNDTEMGKTFIENHPAMKNVRYVENHPSHMGVHAAGILVCNNPISKYCGVNSKDNRIGMLDKNDAEEIDLLKIDALGLKTMTILAGVCDQIGKPYTWIHTLPKDDPETYKVFNDHRFNGIFQFEGDTIQKIAKDMPIENIEDISAINAIGRPGPIESGGTRRYLNFRSGRKETEYVNNHPLVVDATKNTYGIIIYQEQVMRIVKELGKLSWEDTSKIRKLISKSKGKEALDKFYSKFEKGAVENGIIIEEATYIWDHINVMGAYSFNKSHSVSYSVISYLCGYMKAHYPLEFLVSNLNNSKNDRSALKILRDAVENDGVKYSYFDAEHSMVNWSVKDGILYGGFSSLHGIGPAKAKISVKKRTKLQEGVRKSIEKDDSYFKYLYPGRDLYGDYYTNPKKHNLNRGASTIDKLTGDGKFLIIGCLIKKSLRDANEAGNVKKRDGKFLSGQTTWINITLEDDTGSIMCKIKREDYLKYGKEIAENGKEDKDWYMVYGEKINNWNIMFVKRIKKITRKYGK